MPKVTKFLCVGPGGRKCPCCFPAPGSKARKALMRGAKRREAFEAKRDLKTEMVCD